MIRFELHHEKVSILVCAAILVVLVGYVMVKISRTEFFNTEERTVYLIAIVLMVPAGLMLFYPNYDKEFRDLLFIRRVVLAVMVILACVFVYLAVVAPLEGELDFNREEEHVKAKGKKLLTTPVDTIPPFPIDIVYTWAGENTNSNDRRVANNDELRYSLRSVHKFLPWVNHIYILMNPPAQKPTWFTSEYKEHVTIVDHTTTFPSKADLPSTNSNAIEMTLARVPGLSEHFIYMNDDLFIGKPLPYTFFFTPSGKAIVSSKVKSATEPEVNRLPFTVPPLSRGFYPHLPVPLLKSQLQLFEQKYPGYVKWIRGHKSRKGLGCQPCTISGLKCPCMQIQGSVLPFMYSNNKAIARNEKERSHCSPGYINSNCPHTLDSLTNPSIFTKLLYNPPATFVIQDTAMEPRKRDAMQEKLSRWYPEMFPDVPPFEKSTER